MTVPVQRGGSQDDPTVTSLILDRLNDLAAGFQRLEDRITQRVEGLSDQFVPRGEYEARHGEVRNLITRAEGRIDSESDARHVLEERLTARLEAQDERITSQRRFAITTSLTAALLIIGLLSLIITNLR